MVKYGKEFRKKQIGEWKEKYFKYKAYKQRIKALMDEKNKEEFSLKNDNEKESKISNWTFEFEESLDKDITSNDNINSTFSFKQIKKNNINDSNKMLSKGDLVSQDKKYKPTLFKKNSRISSSNYCTQNNKE